MPYSPEGVTQLSVVNLDNDPTIPRFIKFYLSVLIIKIKQIPVIMFNLKTCKQFLVFIPECFLFVVFLLIFNILVNPVNM